MFWPALPPTRTYLMRPRGEWHQHRASISSRSSSLVQSRPPWRASPTVRRSISGSQKCLYLWRSVGTVKRWLYQKGSALAASGLMVFFALSVGCSSSSAIIADVQNSGRGWPPGWSRKEPGLSLTFASRMPLPSLKFAAIHWSRTSFQAPLDPSRHGSLVGL